MANKEVVVEPAKPEDAKGIAELQMDAFSDEGFQELFPPKDGVGLEYSIRAWASHIAEAAKPTTGIRPAVYVIRGDDGKILSTAFFYIIPAGYATKDIPNWRQRWGMPLPGMGEEKLANFFEGMAKQHELIMKEQPHIFLEVLMTHSTARRRGHGSALLRMGNKVGDELKLASYLDAEADAMGLYESVGYVFQKDAERYSKSSPMVRSPVSA